MNIESRRRRYQTWVLVGIGAFLVLVGLAFFSRLFLFPRVAGTPFFYYFPFFPFGFFFAFLWIFIIFGILRWFFFWPWGWGYRRRYWGRYDDEAYRILRERYARGEITKEQFEQMVHDLGQQNH